MGNNLLEPLKFDETNIDGFIRDHVCALCLGPLVKKFATDRMYLAERPHCGVILQHNHVTRAAAVSHESGCRIAQFELNAVGRKPRSESEILKDIFGY